MKKLPLIASLLFCLAAFAAPAMACPGSDDKDPEGPTTPSFCPGGGDTDPDGPTDPSMF